MSNIPHLNALRAFVVAARHLNFTKAANELQVSPSAVSHQIRLLENYLETRLFIRGAGVIALTREGEYLHQKLEGAFEKIGAAIDEITGLRGGATIKVVLRPFFSSFWLAPRLKSFWAAHPEVNLNLIHALAPETIQFEEIDVAIVWGKGKWDGLESTLLVPGELTPILHRSLAERLGVPQVPADLLRYPLLHEESKLNWSTWFAQMGVGGGMGKNDQIVDDTNVRYQSMINGQGVMLGCPSLLKDQIDCGELIRPFSHFLSDFSYYLVFSAKKPIRSRSRKFIEWILNECRQGNEG